MFGKGLRACLMWIRAGESATGSPQRTQTQYKRKLSEEPAGRLSRVRLLTVAFKQRLAAKLRHA